VGRRLTGNPEVTGLGKSCRQSRSWPIRPMPLFLNHVFIGRRAGWFGLTGRKAYRLLWSSPSIAFLRGRDRRGCESAAPQEISETAIGS